MYCRGFSLNAIENNYLCLELENVLPVTQCKMRSFGIKQDTQTIAFLLISGEVL